MTLPSANCLLLSLFSSFLSILERGCFKGSPAFLDSLVSSVSLLANNTPYVTDLHIQDIFFFQTSDRKHPVKILPSAEEGIAG